MELPQLGQHCSYNHCKQLDFLPLLCKCNQQFCSEHYQMHIQTCLKYIDNKVEPRKIENVYKCSQIDCNETSIVPLICDRCRQHFCIKHRHLTTCSDKDSQQIAEEIEKYAVPVRQFNQAKNVVDQQIQQQLEQQSKKGKNLDMINRIQLMKIKGKAIGLKTIPLCDRTYFNIQHREKTQPIFVSKEWTIGRCIDAVAHELRLRNDNNRSVSKKLRLFKKDGGGIVTKDLSVKLSSLIEENSIRNGDNLVIEYVDNDCEQL